MNSSGWYEEVRRLTDDQHSRLPHAIKPEVITLDLEGDSADGVRPLPGMISLFFAVKGSPLLRQLRAAYGSANVAAIQEAGQEISRVLEQAQSVSVPEAVDQMIASPSYFDFRYRGKTLAPNLGLINGLEFATVLFPYNGGRLDESDFRIIDYRRDPHLETELEYLVVMRPPALSDLERDVLGQVPDDLLELNVGSAVLCPALCVVVVVVVLTTAGWCCLPVQGSSEYTEITLSRETAQQLGPLASARQLVQARREVLSRLERGV
ncbi:MAG: hypothetical protein AAGC60_17120 [Acidobacteriota bacterium]